MTSILWMGWAGFCLMTAPAFSQTASQRVFAMMLSRLSENDSLLQKLTFSYQLHLRGTFYHKNDSARVREEWRVVHDKDSIRVQLLSYRSDGKAEIVKKYECPVKIKPAKRTEKRPGEDPIMTIVWELLDRISRDNKAFLLIDGQAMGKDGRSKHIVRFLTSDRSGSLLIDMQTAVLERLEWTFGKSLGVVSSGQTSMIELAPVIEDLRFPSRLIFNERARALLRRSGSYTEIDIRNFQREEMQ
ncbi:MAG: hypothetical protein ONB44_02340 [candidate division KSB1 bacterium]|nr:hypothetical protein [candidate division KSB1 bacterium]MDZ7300963.1 hypothetical protein [candidate division KSB1 bacterium]MDZ7310359.1 hypothetical protein [candidate division KSB1 bacterium]